MSSYQQAVDDATAALKGIVTPCTTPTGSWTLPLKRLGTLPRSSSSLRGAGTLDMGRTRPEPLER